ncbi:MAG: DUF1080 domain-containing protein [Phycisphaerae bacterium]|nr:DUF1080 domain-containing protein [Phycisphaerae bacterium]
MTMVSRKHFKAVALLGLLTATFTVALNTARAQAAAEQKKVRVLLTADGTHDWRSKEPIFMDLVSRTGDFEITQSKDLNEWLPDRIKKYDLVVIHTTGGKLEDAQADGLIQFVQSGGGVVGIHSASDSFKNSDKYWELIGGRFSGHGHGKFGVEIVDEWHPITVGVKAFEIEDEDYQHAYHPNAGIHVLAKKVGDDRNMAWVKRIGKGRLVHLANGHGESAFKAPEFQRLLINAMYWAARRPVPGSGYVALFDGTDLSHWRIEPDNKSWVVEDGALVNNPGKAYQLVSKEQYGDFVIRLQWKLKPGGNSGLLLRTDTEIQILDDYDPKYAKIKDCQHAGSVYCNIPAKPRVTKKAGEWNSMQVLMRGKEVKVWMNGVKVVDGSFDDTPALKKRPMKGYVTLMYHGGGLWFRDVEIKPLSPEDKAG